MEEYTDMMVQARAHTLRLWSQQTSLTSKTGGPSSTRNYQQAWTSRSGRLQGTRSWYILPILVVQWLCTSPSMDLSAPSLALWKVLEQQLSTRWRTLMARQVLVSTSKSLLTLQTAAVYIQKSTRRFMIRLRHGNQQTKTMTLTSTLAKKHCKQYSNQSDLRKIQKDWLSIMNSNCFSKLYSSWHEWLFRVFVMFGDFIHDSVVFDIFIQYFDKHKNNM